MGGEHEGVLHRSSARVCKETSCVGITSGASDEGGGEPAHAVSHRRMGMGVMKKGSNGWDGDNLCYKA